MLKKRFPNDHREKKNQGYTCPQFQKHLCCCCCCHCCYLLRKKIRLHFCLYFFILILIIFHAVLTTEMFPCLFVCLFIFKIERAYCPESLRRRCQRRKSQYLSLLCFYVYLFIYMFVGLYFLGAQCEFLTTDHYQMIKSTSTN